MGAVEGAGELHSNNLFELTVVSSSMGEIKNRDLEDQCAVRIQFQVEAIDVLQTRTGYACMHYDEDESKFVAN